MKLFAPALVFTAALFSMAQATAPATSTAPATTTATAPATQPQNPECADISNLVKSIPANLMPAPNLRGQALIAQGTKFKEWSDKNAKGKKIDISGIRSQMRGNQIDLSYSANDKISIEFHVLGTMQDTVTCGQISMVNNNGKYTVAVVAQ